MEPWNEIGIDVSDKITVAEALEEADCNFTVKVVPACYKVKGKLNTCNNKFLIIRTDLPLDLGICKSRFVPLQNEILIDIAQPLIDKEVAKIDTIGTFGNGEKVWLLLKLYEHRYTLGKGDVIDHYLLLINGHDANTSIQMGILPFRLLCGNMLSQVGNYMIKCKHTENAEEMIQFFRSGLEKRLGAIPEIINIFRSLERSKVQEIGHVIMYFRKVLKMPKQLTTRSQNILNKIKDKLPEEPTWWDAYNALTNYLNYEIGNSQENRLNNMWFGGKMDSALIEVQNYATF